MLRSSYLLVVLVFAACSGPDEPLVGDTAFRITQECPEDGSECEPVCEDTWCEVCEDSDPPSEGGCWITGIGHLVDTDGTKDNFGGNGMPMKAGYLRGQWEHVDHATGRKFHGFVAYLVCRKVAGPGPDVPKAVPNQAYYGGPGRMFDPATNTWHDGYWFDVMAEDHGEPGKLDEYYFSARAMADTTTALYETGGILGGGNFQIHPPNNGHPFTNGTLPAWVPLQP